MHNGGEYELKGLMIFGAISDLVGNDLELSHSGNYWDEIQRSERLSDGVWFPAKLIDKQIDEGKWNVNTLANVVCSPDVCEWPERWRELQWDRWREFEKRREAGQN
jgi:hypothetical protein